MTRPWLVAALLVLPLALLAGCKDQEDDAAAVVRQAAQPAELPDLGAIPPFEMTSQKAAPFGSQQLAGKPYLAAFMFTRCPTVCPRLTRRMTEIANALDTARLEMNLVSFSVDGEHDTPEVLSAYAKKFGADRPNWFFVTGDTDKVAQTAEQSFKIGVSGKAEEGKEHMGISHGSHLVLVDANGHIRGYFRSFDDDTVVRVVEGAKKL